MVDSSALIEPEPASVIELVIPLTPTGASVTPDVESVVPGETVTAEDGNGLVPFDPPPVLHAATANERSATKTPSRVRDNTKLHRSEKAMLRKVKIRRMMIANDTYHHGGRGVSSLGVRRNLSITTTHADV